jgi:hypothetical protein
MTDDNWVRDALEDAVRDIEPAPALDTIQARTGSQRRSRAWVWATSGAAVGVAATLVTVALMNSPSTTRGELPPVDTPSPSVTAISPSTTVAVGIYYVGDTPKGPRLFREFDRVDAGTRLLAAVLKAMTETPDDPDYRVPWPQLDEQPIDGVHFDGVGDDGILQISLASDALHDRPAGMTRAEAELAIEQVVYTVQAASQSRAPVQFSYNSNPIDTVLGVPTSEPLANAPQLDVLATVNITNPESGAVVDGTLEMDGVASSYEATVPWEIRRGDVVVKEGYATAEGYMGRLYPWRDTADVTDLAPGEYTFVAMTSDASGGLEGGGSTEDTKQITIK